MTSTPAFPGSPSSRLIGSAAGPDPAGRAADAARAAELSALVRARLELPATEAVTVQQVRCGEPGCPPLETVVAVLGPRPRRWTVPRPLGEIDPDLVASLIALEPEGQTP